MEHWIFLNIFRTSMDFNRTFDGEWEFEYDSNINTSIVSNFRCQDIEYIFRIEIVYIIHINPVLMYHEIYWIYILISGWQSWIQGTSNPCPIIFTKRVYTTYGLENIPWKFIEYMIYMIKHEIFRLNCYSSYLSIGSHTSLYWVLIS